MSSTAVISSVAPTLMDLELANMRLPVRGLVSIGESQASRRTSRQRTHDAGCSTHLEFLTVTQNPEVERKLTQNRRTVRSHAIKHAVQERKRVKRTLSRRIGDPSTVESSPLQSGSLTSDGSTNTSDDSSREETLQVSMSMEPRPLFPVGTLAAATSIPELDLVCSRKCWSLWQHWRMRCHD